MGQWSIAGAVIRCVARHAAPALVALAGVPVSGAPPGYAERSSCRSCHSEIYDSYQQTPMGRSFYDAAGASVIEDWERDNRFYHEPSDRYYEMFQRPDGFYVRRYQKDRAGQAVNVLERRVTHIMGSGERARSYLHQSADGRILELPVSWYSQQQRWAMAPGYDRPRHPGFKRQVNHKCMFCHNAYPDTPPERARPGWDADVRFPLQLPQGIDCQRCHGPGAEHVEAARSGQSSKNIRSAIVHPGKLPAERQVEICMQCHLETTTFRLPESLRRFGRPFYSYRPGEPLGDYIVHFDHAPGTGHDDKFEIVSAAYRLRQSLCFQQSAGNLLCTTCHDPHRSVEPAKRAAHYRERCLSCHSPVEQHPPVEGGLRASDCVSCHMPLRRTEDVVQVAMTDHKIPRRPPARDLLAPLREKTDEEQRYQGEVVWYYPLENGPEAEIYWAVAQVKEKANLQAGLKRLRRLLSGRPFPHPEPYFELAEALAAAGQPEEAVAAYRKAIEADPAFPHAHNNLGNLLMDLGRSGEAIRQYLTALELDAESADVWANLGLAYRETGKMEEALNAFRRAVEANPLWPDAHLNLGSLLLARGQTGSARRALQTALAIEPSTAEAHFNLGLLRFALGDREAAAESFDNAARWGSGELARLARGKLQQLQKQEQ